jgi:glycine/D-amino acid oxidase-like deaminating enzyme
MKPIAIVGIGLAGACTAWHLWRRGAKFRIIDSGRRGSSHVAAGLVHPVTGKNCTVAEDFAMHRDEAQKFYHECESVVKQQVWFPLEVLRLLSLSEQKKLLPKFQTGPAAEWVNRIFVEERWPDDVAISLKGGARLDVSAFLQTSRAFFSALGLLEEREFLKPSGGEVTIMCEGAQGLMSGSPIAWQHRCAKGEILTVHAPSWQQSRMITGRGWLVSIGNDCYKVGATYEWNELDDQPTAVGLIYLESIARNLGGDDYTIRAHDAGIRPILRKSQPVAGKISPDVYVLNGLGSKGSLSAPWASRCLVEHLLEGVPLHSRLSLENYFATFGRPV